jgi:hypothetical protein
LARGIVLLNTASSEGYAGFGVWKDRLIEMGIEGNQILSAHLCADDNNTLTEAEAVVKFAKRSNSKSMIVSATPFHQIRAFMTTVRVTLAEYPQLKVYSLPGEALPWSEMVIHSQGLLPAKRSELIAAEFAGINEYSQKGDLISFDKVIAYLNQRDQSKNL